MQRHRHFLSSSQDGVYEEYMEGASEVNGRWMELAMPVVCLSVRGALGSGWVARQLPSRWKEAGGLGCSTCGFGGSTASVRACPPDRRRGWPGARTYSGQRARRKGGNHGTAAGLSLDLRASAAPP